MRAITPIGAISLGLVMFLASPTLAQDGGSPSESEDGELSVYAMADLLTLEGHAEIACQLLVDAYGVEMTDLGALTRFGTCLLAQEKLEESVTVLQYAKSLFPDDVALGEQYVLAQLALLLSQTVIAEAEAVEEAVPAPTIEAVAVAPASVAASAPAPVPTPVPASAPAAVPAQPPAMPPLPGPMFSGQVSLGTQFNSNVNGGTYNDSFIGFGLPVVVAPDSKERAGTSTRLGVEGSVTVPLDWENAIRLNGGLGANIQHQHSDFSRLDLFASGAWITGTNVTGGQVRPHADLSWVAGLYDGLTLGVEGSGHHKISEVTTLTGMIDVSHRFNANAAETGWAIAGRTGVRHVINPQLQIGANLVGERVAVSSAARSFWLVGAEAFVGASITQEIGLSLNAGLDLVGFDGSIAMFTGNREDLRWRIGAALNWSLDQYVDGLSMQASYSFAHQQSNQDLYDTNRHLASIGFRYAF